MTIRVIALAAVLSVGCASASKIGDEGAYQPQPSWSSELTTSATVEYLVGQLAGYRVKHADLQGRIAYAERLMKTPEKQATETGPWGPMFSGINRAVGAVGYPKLLAALADLDADWHSFLMDILGNAPSVMDCDSRAVALDLSARRSAAVLGSFSGQQGKSS
ncbi:MAG: hypothetical protein OXC11_04915 [Rhodospirillales bacterium]|nr:hypothetical protein [Rhodospirillales bacterium]